MHWRLTKRASPLKVLLSGRAKRCTSTGHVASINIYRGTANSMRWPIHMTKYLQIVKCGRSIDQDQFNVKWCNLLSVMVPFTSDDHVNGWLLGSNGNAIPHTYYYFLG